MTKKARVLTFGPFGSLLQHRSQDDGTATTVPIDEKHGYGRIQLIEEAPPVYSCGRSGDNVRR